MLRKERSHLTQEERCQIYALLTSGMSKRAIARQINVNHSSIVREIKRNTGKRAYRHKQAHELACDRRHCASAIARKLTPANVMLIKRKLLATQASPEQISGQLKEFHGIRISPESIYRLIWKDKRAGGQLYTHLRRRSKKYNKRSLNNSGRGIIPNRVDIDQRPAIVEEKKRFGDFELDTIIGAQHKGAIISIVDRATKHTFLRLIPKATAENVKNGLIEILKSLSKRMLIQTYTSDNGKEFASHQKVTEALGGDFYFCKPYHSWQRGLNEHTNGLVRQYLPKKTDFTKISHESVADIEFRLNNRPRKILNFLTPAQAFLSLTGFSPGGAFQC